jgi:hypothetical protein
MKSFKYSGVWWFPFQEKRKVAGTVTFTEKDGINLALKGILEPNRNQMNPQFQVYPLILGLTKDGLAITLLDCEDIHLSFTISSRRSGKQKCWAKAAYIGVHFTNSQEILFDKMDLYYSFLPQWAGVFPFRGHQKPFEEVKATTEKGTITVQSTNFLGNEWIKEEDLPKAVWMKIEVHEALPLSEWITRFISPLQNLLTLTTQRPNAIVDIVAYSKQKVMAQSNDDLSEIPVQVVFLPEIIPYSTGNDVFPETNLFSLQEIAGDFTRIIDTWLKVADELDSVCDLFFEVRYTQQYLKDRFLFFAQAVETYQYRRSERRYLPDDKFQGLMELLYDACPEDHREWLEDKLQHGNKPTFRNQLRDLVRKTSEILLPLIGQSSRKRQAFTDSVYYTRNYLTHHTREDAQRAANSEKLLFITHCLSIALQVCLLYELGFTEQQCVEIFHKHELYQFILAQKPG